MKKSLLSLLACYAETITSGGGYLYNVRAFL